MKKRMTYNRRLAHATRDLFEDSSYLTPDDIHRGMYGHKCPSKSIYKDIKRRLTTIKRMLNREYDMATFLVNAVPPNEITSSTAAKSYVPGKGKANTAEAIGVVNGVGSKLIYLAEKEIILARMGGGMKHNISDIMIAAAAHQISTKKCQAVVARGMKAATVPASVEWARLEDKRSR
ncbi:MAG: hypothetical protein OEQ39_04440 [Gammaproteobacteria bacterium]|nr:hypothetical protein [Gammaproteobacteria bacterium]